MNCECCNAVITQGDEREHYGKILCEDCYIVALSPLKTCDPWAVHSAKTFEEHSGGASTLTPLQMKILEILKADGPMTPEILQAKLEIDLKLSDLHREFASLRHMEKARAKKNGDKVLWRIW